MEHWSEQRRKLSINALKLWENNPRINYEAGHRTTKQLIKAIYEDNKDGFKDLLKSIVTKGFTYFDTVIVWRANPNDDAFTVAEGNMRVAVLKVLLKPSLAPKEIQHLVKKLSRNWEDKKIEKIKVAVAPKIEDAYPYIFDRHNGSFSITKWSKEAQYKFIVDLLEKEDDLNYIVEITGLKLSQIYEAKSLYNLLSYAKKSFDNNPIYDFINNPKLFSFSNLDRFLKDEGKQYLGIEIIDGNIKINASKDYFDNALLKLLEHMQNGTITSRTINTKEHLLQIISKMQIDIEKGEGNYIINNDKLIVPNSVDDKTTTDDKNITHNNDNLDSFPDKNTKKIKNTKRLIPDYLSLTTDNERLEKTFEELQKLPFLYKNAQLVLLRTLLELALRQCIEENDFKNEILQYYRSPEKAYTIKNMLNFILDKTAVIKKKEIKGEMKKFLDNNTWFGLDSLHKGTHSSNIVLSKEILQQYWKYLEPFLKEILDITEIK